MQGGFSEKGFAGQQERGDWRTLNCGVRFFLTTGRADQGSTYLLNEDVFLSLTLMYKIQIVARIDCDGRKSYHYRSR